MRTIGKTFEFSASHRLVRKEWDEAKNRRIFGKCYGLHGHNYHLEIAVTGPRDGEMEMILDASVLEEIVDRLVIDDLDHRHLNDVPWLEGQLPTMEILTDAIWERLAPEVAKLSTSLRLSRVRLWETRRIFAERVE